MTGSIADGCDRRCRMQVDLLLQIWRYLDGFLCVEFKIPDLAKLWSICKPRLWTTGSHALSRGLLDESAGVGETRTTSTTFRYPAQTSRFGLPSLSMALPHGTTNIA